MAQGKLPVQFRRRKLAALLLSLTTLGCQAVEPPIGMSILFINQGKFGIGVRRFDPDGQKGPNPGPLGPSPVDDWRGGKQMSYMPGDSNRPVPRFVEVEWWQQTAESIELKNSQQRSTSSLPDQARSDPRLRRDEVIAKGLTFQKIIDLTSVITPGLIAEVRSNPRGTNLKLLVLFTDGDVTIKASPEKWR